MYFPAEVANYDGMLTNLHDSIKECTNPRTPSSTQASPQPANFTKKRRLILDLRYVNKQIYKQKIKFGEPPLTFLAQGHISRGLA